MASQTDVLSAYTASDAALVDTRCRMRGVVVVITTGGANPVIFYDNASAASGTELFKVHATVAGNLYIEMPGEGILARNGVYCDTGSAAAVTLIYS